MYVRNVCAARHTSRICRQLKAKGENFCLPSSLAPKVKVCEKL